MVPLCNYPRVSDFVLELQERGQYSFAKKDLQKLGYPDIALNAALRRLVEKGFLASPCNGFFVIVTPQYRKMKSLPPMWFLDAWMKYKQTDYYVGLLSAAALHGVSHQAIQETQIVAPRVFSKITLGQARFRFFFKRAFKTTILETKETPTGFIKVSSKAATLIDLVRYMDKIGSLSIITTAIYELAEEIDRENFRKTIENSDIEQATLQRLGFIFESLGYEILCNDVFEITKNLKLHKVLLSITSPIKTGPISNRWKVIGNETIEREI